MNDPLVKHLNPLFVSFLNDVQLAVLRAYAFWVGGENFPGNSWTRLSELLTDLSVMLCGSSRDAVVKSILQMGWCDRTDGAEVFCELLDWYTKPIRRGSLDFFLSELTPDVLDPPKLSKQDEWLLTSDICTLRNPAKVKTVPDRGVCYIYFQLNGRPQASDVTVQLPYQAAVRLRAALDKAISSMDQYR